jgi:sulfur relay (sulfurtransferase) DsrC/TusE family protein
MKTIILENKMALADLERDGHGYLVDLNQWDERQRQK